MKSLPSSDQLDAIILDFGGVLFDIDYPRPAVAFKELGLDRFEELYSKANQSDLFDRLETGTISNTDFLKALQQHLPPHVTLNQVEAAWNTILLDIPKARIDFVHQLKERYRMFLLSNTNAIHVAEFEKTIDEKMGLPYFYDGFEKIHYSNVLGIKKPAPSTYLHLCELHDLDPSRTLFVDDSPQHVKGALDAGLYAYHLELPQEEITEILAHLIS